MDMGSSMGDSASSPAACQISMLWNWYTIDSCFLSSTWHVKTKAQFAGTVIGVFLIVACIEGVRRMHREYDRRLIAKWATANFPSTASVDSLSNIKPPDRSGGKVVVTVAPTWVEQSIRAVFYGIQFTAAFLIMLMGMYYNGYVLFAIFLGGTAGYIAFAGDTLVAQVDIGSGCCC